MRKQISFQTLVKLVTGLMMLPVHAKIDQGRHSLDRRHVCLHCSDTATQHPCMARGYLKF